MGAWYIRLSSSVPHVSIYTYKYLHWMNIDLLPQCSKIQNLGLMNLYFLCLIHEWRYLSIFRALYQCLSICARDLHWKLSLFYFYLQCKHIYSNNWCSNSISSCIKLKISKHCFLKYKNLSFHQNFWKLLHLEELQISEEINKQSFPQIIRVH